MNGAKFALIFLGFLCASAGVAQAPDLAARYAALEASESADGGSWFQFAGDARTSGNTAMALSALLKAEKLGISPVSVGLERARIAIVASKPTDAIVELQRLFDTGFTAVQALANDPLINSLAGNTAYDDLIATMSVQAFPCEHEEKVREFDFWLGDWVVHGPNGQLAGHNSIRSAERGCVITEHWQGAFGGTGMSINYLDKISGNWVQVWMAEGGSQIIISGGLTDDGMSLHGTLHTVGNGSTVPFRALWTPLPDGRVRQFFEQSNDDGKTWVPWFEGFYTRVQTN
jgi:hypothetical protein